MNEMPAPELTGKQYEVIEALQMDPVITRAFAKARGYGVMLRDEPKTSDEINEIIAELDDMLGNYLNATCIVTARVAFVDVTAAEQTVLPPQVFEDMSMVFGGFVRRQLNAVSSAGDEDEDERCFYELKVTFMGMTRFQDGRDVLTVGAADIDEVVSIESPQVMSPERASVWLGEYCPDILAKIDEVSLSPDNDPWKAVQTLQGIQVSSGDDPEMQNMFLNSLNIYVNHRIEFDTTLPYVVNAQGAVWQQRSDEVSQLSTVDVARKLAFIKKNTIVSVT